MKKIIKKILSKVLTPVIKRMGYSKGEQRVVTDANGKNNLLFNFYTLLIQLNFNPKHIVDVGANHGTWTKETLKYFPEANFTLLEPQYWMKDSIQDLLDSNPRVKFNAVGAGEKKGTFKFTIVDRDDSCTFKLTEEEATKQGYKQIEVPVVTLNEFLPDTGLAVPDIIKIDAEGLDIEVLKGSADFFGKTEVFMVEAGVVNKEFNNSILNLINFMDTNGYRVFEITDINRPFATPVLWLVELVFIKKNGFIDSKSFI